MSKPRTLYIAGSPCLSSTLPPAISNAHRRSRSAIAAGCVLYKLRQQTVEPDFGIIKESMGFRSFSLQGHKKVSLESP
jgi:hypothetical protein